MDYRRRHAAFSDPLLSANADGSLTAFAVRAAVGPAGKKAFVTRRLRRAYDPAPRVTLHLLERRFERIDKPIRRRPQSYGSNPGVASVTGRIAPDQGRGRRWGL
jgi:hypothetical protein